MQFRLIITRSIVLGMALITMTAPVLLIFTTWMLSEKKQGRGLLGRFGCLLVTWAIGIRMIFSSASSFSPLAYGAESLIYSTSSRANSTDYRTGSHRR